MRTEDGYIINKCLDGNSAAFGFLVDKYKGSIYAFAYSRLGNFHDAEDVAQEVFIKAYQNLRNLRRWDNFLAWLYSITSNVCKMHLRDTARMPDRDYVEDQNPEALERSSMESYREELAVQSLHEALESLPETRRQVLSLHYLGGMKIKEVARFLGKSPRTIDRWLDAARSQLREEMLVMMNDIFDRQRLQAVFTLRIVDAVKRIRIHPIPRIAHLPWVLSLAAGAIFTILSLMPDSSLMNLTITSESPPVLSEPGIIGETPVRLLEDSEMLAASSYNSNGSSGETGQQPPQNLTPGGQEYTFVGSWPEEIIGLRSPLAAAVDDYGNIYVNSHGIVKFDSEGKFLGKLETSGPGIAIDSSENIYVASMGNNRIRKLDSEGNLLTEWGTLGSEDGQFNEPRGVAVDNSGNVYVSERRNNRVQKFDSEGKFLMKWGTEGDGDGQFKRPRDVSVDSSGNIYVADAGNYRIQKFDSNGNFLTKWGSRGEGDGQFLQPYYIEVDSQDNVYVPDWTGMDGCIQKFDSNGKFLERWGVRGYGDGQFISPSGIAMDKAGNFYIPEFWHSRIQKFDPDGNFLKKWGGADADGQFDAPFSLALDKAGNVYVADHSNQRIQKFGPRGKFLAKWGEYGSGNGQFKYPRGIAVDGSGNVYVAEVLSSRIQKFDSHGKFLAKWGKYGIENGQFKGPLGMAVNSKGNVYVVEYGNSRIQVFDSEGNFLMKWGSQGNGDGQLNYPDGGIAVDAFDNVYVADSLNYRIQVFDSEGKFLTKWGKWGSEDGQFGDLNGIAVDSSGRVYVADSVPNHRIQVFDSKGNFLTKLGTQGDIGFSYPFDIAVSDSGDVYVADSGNNRITVFHSPVGGAVDPVNKQSK